MILLVTIFMAAYGFGALFIACELGQRLIDSFDQIGVIMYQVDWPLCPLQVKRMFPTCLAVLQQPVSIQCFGSISCTREVFKKVKNQSKTFPYMCILSRILNLLFSGCQ